MRVLKSLIMLLILLPTFVWAVSISENYQLDGGIDNGGNYSDSENYQATDSINGENILSASTGDSNTGAINVSNNSAMQDGIISNIISSINNVIDDIAKDGIVEAVVQNKIISENKNNFAAMVAALSVGVASIPLAANIPLSYSFGNLISSIFPFLGRRKKLQSWGTVFDAESHQPIAQAIVRIYNSDTKKIMQTQITDIDGRFDLNIASGEYYFEAYKNNFTFPSKIVSSDYHGGNIKVEQGKNIEINIPLDPRLNQVISFVKSLWGFKKILEILYYPLLFIGATLSIIFYVKYQDLSNLLVLVFYTAIFVYEYYKLHKSRPYGLVLDQSNKNPINLAIVRIFDDESGKLITTKVTDIKGTFVFLVNRGKYYLSAIKQGYDQYKGNSIDFKTSTLINTNIMLKRNSQILDRS